MPVQLKIVLFIVLLLQIILVSLQAISARGGMLVLLVADAIFLILLIVCLFIS